MVITSHPYGITVSGETVNQYTITNRRGVSVSIIEYGAIITNFIVPDQTGTPVDIVLGYDTLAEYEKDSFSMGAFVGRYAGNIKNDRFSLGGREYTVLHAEDGVSYLRGAMQKRVFRASVQGGGVRFSYHSPDGDEGFSGAVDMAVTYELDDNNVFSLHYEARTDADTVLNFTNHTFFNLTGHDSGKVDDHLLQIAAETFLETADDGCPTGQVLPVAGTPLDFTKLHRIGQGYPIHCEQMELVGGYDHCYCLKEGAAPAVLVYSPASGIALEVVTTQPGLQFYSGDYLGEGGATPGKQGARYHRRAGFALETQHYPDSPHFPEFPTTVVKKGETYQETTLWQVQIAQNVL